MKNKSTSKSYRIAAYLSVSTEEQAANPEGSVKNQEQRIREYVRHRNMDGTFGEIVEVFCDPGISAKNMNRPKLQKLLEQVSDRTINLIIVTDLSRLTRSTKDFALLWDFLRENNCKFQSLREAFDTTNAAGEMIMFTLANFAQTAKKLNEMKVQLPKTRQAAGISRGEFLRAQMIHGVLRLKSYTGVRVFKVGDRFEETKAAWDAIVDDV